MPYSLYIDSDSACCIFHPLWHCHSCQCCRDVVAIELLWLRDSLIVGGWAGVVKSIQCSEWFLPHTRQCWTLLSLWNQIGRASECERLMGRMIGKIGYCLEKTMESLKNEKNIRRNPNGNYNRKMTPLSLFPSLQIKFSTTERSISDYSGFSFSRFISKKALCLEFRFKE